MLVDTCQPQTDINCPRKRANFGTTIERTAFHSATLKDRFKLQVDKIKARKF